MEKWGKPDLGAIWSFYCLFVSFMFGLIKNLLMFGLIKNLLRNVTIFMFGLIKNLLIFN